jgi:molybdopterin molybdotransferase
MPRQRGVLAEAVEPNGAREHYMRARRTPGGLAVAGRQDSSLLSVLATADALVVRPPGASAAAAGAEVEFIPLP